MSVIDSLSLGGTTYSLRDNDGRAIIAGTESSTTSAHAYSAGDYFILNDTLYEATAAIAVGGTITVGTNCQATTVCGEVGQLKSDLVALGANTPINIANASETAFYIDATGKIQSGNASVLYPVFPDITYYLKTTGRWGSNYALLQDETLVANTTPNYATGYTGRVTIAKNELAVIVPPADANYILIRTDGDKQYFTFEFTTNVVKNTVISETVDFATQAFITKYIDGSGVVKNGNRSCLIPVEGGQKIKFVTTYQYGSSFTFLKDADLIADTTPNYATGYSGIVALGNGKAKWATAPDDAKFVVFRMDITDYTKFGMTKVYRNLSKDDLPAFVHNSNTVYVAASNSTENDKAMADFVCSGTNDERTIQSAINAMYNVATKRGTVVKLLAGDYYIDSFPNSNYDGHVAIMLPSLSSPDTIGSDTFAVTIEGCDYNTENTCIHLTDDCYDALNTTDSYSIFACQNNAHYNHFAFHDLRIFIPSAQKNIICLDGMEMGSMELRRCRCTVNDHGTWGTLPSYLPVFGCIGVRGAAFDSNSWNYTWEAVYCIGFGQGFACAGEHLLAIKCVAIYGRYGFTFHANQHSIAKYNDGYQSSHPITLIDCSDEANANFWLFGNYNTRKPVVNAYNVSIEYYDAWFNTFEGQGNYATEVVPDSFRGDITYAITGGSVSIPFWGVGSGNGFHSENLNHKFVGTSEDRRAYAPNMGQRFYDQTLDVDMVCVNPSSRKWVKPDGTFIRFPKVNASGTLKDSNGNNLSGTMTLISCTDGSEYTVTASGGTWSAELWADRYSVLLDGYYVNNYSLIIRNYVTTGYAITAYTAYTVSGTITGTVTRTIYFVSTTEPLWVFSITPSNGAYSISLPAGSYEVKSRQTITSPTTAIAVNSNETVNITV